MVNMDLPRRRPRLAATPVSRQDSANAPNTTRKLVATMLETVCGAHRVLLAETNQEVGVAAVLAAPNEETDYMH